MKIIAITPNKKYDYLANATIEGLKENSITIIASDEGNGISQDDVYSDDEIVEHSKDADFIFAIWGKATNERPAKYYLLEKINRPDKTVFIDGAEWTFDGQPRPKSTHAKEAKENPLRRRGEPWIWKEMNEYCKWHFKRECYQQDIEQFHCIPYPFASLKSYFLNPNPIKNREVDALCSFGHNTTGLREDVEKYFQTNYIHDLVFIGMYPRDKYLYLMSKSKIVIDAWGGGDCNARRWEGHANGAVMMIQKYNIIIPYPYVDGKNIIEYSTMDEFHDKFNFYMTHKERLPEMAKESYEHTVKFHTSKERIKYVLDIIEKD